MFFKSMFFQKKTSITVISIKSLKNCYRGGLINVSFIVLFRHPRYFFLHCLYLFVIIVIMLCVANKIQIQVQNSLAKTTWS